MFGRTRASRQRPPGLAGPIVDSEVVAQRFPLRSPMRLWGRLLLLACVAAVAALAISRLEPGRRDEPLQVALALFPTAALVLVFGTLLVRNQVEVRRDGLAVTVMGWRRRIRWQDVDRIWAGFGEVQVDLRPTLSPLGLLRPGRRHLHFRPRRSEPFLGAVARMQPRGDAIITRLG